jgi:hypothetical protein
MSDVPATRPPVRACATLVTMDAAARRTLLDRYAAGPAEVRAALAGASDTELDARPDDGGWTAREVVHHLADSETTSTIRLRRLLAEDDPVIAGYDQDRFAEVLRYDRPIDQSLAVLDAVRASNVELLELLSDADFARTGTHTEDGAYGVERWLAIYAEHAHDHADQIRAARTFAV